MDIYIVNSHALKLVIFTHVNLPSRVFQNEVPLLITKSTAQASPLRSTCQAGVLRMSRLT